MVWLRCAYPTLHAHFLRFTALAAPKHVALSIEVQVRKARPLVGITNALDFVPTGDRSPRQSGFPFVALTVLLSRYASFYTRVRTYVFTRRSSPLCIITMPSAR
jgi:hypothetical protein